MIPKSLSASSVMVLEGCPARWVAEYFLRGEQPGGSAASLGSLCHEVLELWVKSNCHTNPDIKFSWMHKAYDELYHTYFTDRERYDEGLGMLRTWYNRSHPLPHTVLSTEVKESFPLRVGKGADRIEVPFNYIWDRCDRIDLEDGRYEVEVIDYKTIMAPLSAQMLENKIQARCYGLAAQIKYPEAERVWVTFDLLRYDSVGVVFTREQNINTYKYLKGVLRRLLPMDAEQAPETINPDCRWCVRKNVCKAIRRHGDVGGVLALDNPMIAANERARLDNQKKALEKLIDELDDYIIRHCEQEDTLEFETDDVLVKLGASSRRGIDSERAARIIGADLMTEYGQLRMGDVDRLLKGDQLNNEQKSQLRQLIKRNYGAISVKTTPKNPIDAE